MGSGPSKPDILSRDARYVAIDRTVPFLRYGYPIPAAHVLVLPFRFAQSQLYVERSCVDEDCSMGPKKEETPTPASDVLRDAMDAPLEGLRWIHGFIPSSPLLFVQCVPSCARSCRWPTRRSMEWSNVENSPDVPMRRLDLAEVEAWIEERRRASDAASIQRAPTPGVRKRKTRPVRRQ